jgi:hypothetical protein
MAVKASVEPIAGHLSSAGVFLATCLASALAVSLPQPAHARHIAPPPVPPEIQVPPGNAVFLEGHGVGAQNYICLPTTSSKREGKSGADHGN